MATEIQENTYVIDEPSIQERVISVASMLSARAAEVNDDEALLALETIKLYAERNLSLNVLGYGSLTPLDIDRAASVLATLSNMGNDLNCVFMPLGPMLILKMDDSDDTYKTYYSVHTNDDGIVECTATRHFAGGKPSSKSTKPVLLSDTDYGKLEVLGEFRIGALAELYDDSLEAYSAVQALVDAVSEA